MSIKVCRACGKEHAAEYIIIFGYRFCRECAYEVFAFSGKYYEFLEANACRLAKCP